MKSLAVKNKWVEKGIYLFYICLKQSLKLAYLRRLSPDSYPPMEISY